MPRVAAILLAAGLSSRMGPRNKLLLPVAGMPLVRRVAQTYLSAIDGSLTVVTGFEADLVRRALAGLNVQIAHNDRYAEGQPRSVATGLRCAPDVDLLLIGLGDQPLLTPQDLADLTAAHLVADKGKITIPMQAERRGNPIVVPRDLRRRLTENPRRPGCMRFTRDHPEHVQAAALGARGFYADVDTPEDYATLVQTEKETSL